MRDKEKMSEIKKFNPMALREKYSVGSLNKKNNFSSFWLTDGWDTTGSVFDDEDVKPGTDLIALSSYRRAVGNFVGIVTGDPSIKVTFTTHGDSFTDGKNVTISSKLDDKLFDSTVGLALHEGSHIKLSDFDFLKNIENNIPEEYFLLGEKKGYSKNKVMKIVKDILNYVEDRRIDNYIFTSSPGYKGYYHSMYDKYFYAKIIDKALISNEYIKENLDSYMFRLINLANKNTMLNALNGLRKIWNEIDLKNIGRLDSTEKAFSVSLEVYSIIMNNLADGVENVDPDTGEVSYSPADEGDDSDSQSASGNGEGTDGDKKSPKELTDEEFKDMLDNSELDGSTSGSTSDKDSEITLSEHQKKQLENAIKKQKKFMDGEVSKKKVTKKEKRDLDTVESSGMSYVEVAKGLEDRYYGKKTPTKVVMVKKLTKELIDSDTINMLSTSKYSRYHYNRNEENEEGYVEDGIRLGTILGRKLQVRGESRETKWTRLDSGRIDKRLVAELGFGNERVFQNTFVESYSDAFLHISVDASGSMCGDKWTKTMTSVVALCKAVDMINNVDVVVSLRSTQHTGNRYARRGSNMEYPIVLIAYDSRIDKFRKVRNLFPYLRASGTTPEGLCFEAILSDIVPTSKDKDSYFLNFSDGMPMFGNDDIDYHHDTAINHTKKMVDEIRYMGVHVMSYFIGDSYDRSHGTDTFKRMYGNDAQFIDVTSVMSVAKTMNKKFLEK
jgi:hypothetical protein